MAAPSVSAHRSSHNAKTLQSPRSRPRDKLLGRLNLFQAMMLRWRELHPYTAVHVVRLNRPLVPARLRRCIGSRLETAGLTGLVLDRRRARYEFRGGPAAAEPAILAGGGDAHRVVGREIERQLNLPFPSDGAFVPFRFFAIEADGSFYLGIAYDHFIAGGDSIAILLEKLCADYATDAAAASLWTPRRYPRSYRRLFLRHLRHALTGLARLPAMAASCRRSFRAPCRAQVDSAAGFISLRVERSTFGTVRSRAKAWGVTVNDLFLAALLLALVPVTEKRSATSRRHELAVASIVNLRAQFEANAEETFGQFLASFRISHPVPPGIGLADLARQVHAETSLVRERKLYLQSLLALGAVALAWRFLGPERRRSFLAKHYPLWAGLSTLNVDSLRDGVDPEALPSEYLRAVPTGPLAPLVVAATTLGGVLQLGFSFRPADIGRDAVEQVATEFIRRLEVLE
jgi:hypothetical protein